MLFEAVVKKFMTWMGHGCAVGIVTWIVALCVRFIHLNATTDHCLAALICYVHCHCHRQGTLSHCVATVRWLKLCYTVLLPSNCAVTLMMPCMWFCLSHIALHLFCGTATVKVPCLDHAALPLPGCSGCVIPRLHDFCVTLHSCSQDALPCFAAVIWLWTLHTVFATSLLLASVVPCYHSQGISHAFFKLPHNYNVALLL